MALLELREVSRVYKTSTNKDKYALRNVSLSFSYNGLVGVLGKSGSGKSTLINLIGLFDKPSKGEIYYKEKPMSKMKQKDIDNYHKRDIGIVFQHYHLLDDYSVIFNVMLPYLINGGKINNAKNKALNLLKSIDFPDNLYETKVKNLSGGEKERIAILRAIINEPQILLCDEPTGALDSFNSLKIMNLLKEISKDKLVIVVSHNQDLIQEYADRIITLADGRLVDNKIINKSSVIKERAKINQDKFDNWSQTITQSNIKRRFKRNLISSVALIVGITASLLIIGFTNGAKPSIKKQTLCQFDYQTATLSKEETSAISGSAITLVKQLRPSIEELNNYEDALNNFWIEPCFDYFFPNYQKLIYDNKEYEEIYLSSIFSFENKNYDASLLLIGSFPSSDNMKEVLINKAAYQLLGENIIDNKIHLSQDIRVNTDVDSGNITDSIVYSFDLKVVGVVDELSFMAIPKIYYSYTALSAYFMDYLLPNYSQYENSDINLYDYVTNKGDNEDETSYSYNIFLKDYKNVEALDLDIGDELKIESLAKSKTEALINLIDASSIGMEIFLVITLIGTILIMGIISLSSYTEDKKTSAILKALGTAQNKIIDIYAFESLFMGSLSLILSFILTPLLEIGLNKLIYLFTGFKQLIDIPLFCFLGYNMLLPFLAIILTFAVCVIATSVPISFSKRISIKEELNSND